MTTVLRYRCMLNDIKWTFYILYVLKSYVYNPGSFSCRIQKATDYEGKLSMDYTTLPLPPRSMTDPATFPVVSLYEALQQIPDLRRAQGKRYELALLVCLIVLAKLAGQKTLSGATEWIRHRGSALAQRFGVRREKMPCQMTYCNVLSKIEAKQLDAILAAFFLG